MLIPKVLFLDLKYLSAKFLQVIFHIHLCMTHLWLPFFFLKPALNNEKYATKHISGQGLISKIWKKSLKTTIGKQTASLKVGKKSEQIPHQRRDTYCIYNKKSMGKDSHIMLLGNSRLTHPWTSATYLLGWLKSKTLTTANADGAAERPSLLAGMHNGPATLEDGSPCLLTLKHRLTVCPEDLAPRDLWTENFGSHQNLRVDVYGSFIHNCPKLEAAIMPFNG